MQRRERTPKPQGAKRCLGEETAPPKRGIAVVTLHDPRRTSHAHRQDAYSSEVPDASRSPRSAEADEARTADNQAPAVLARRRDATAVALEADLGLGEGAGRATCASAQRCLGGLR